MNSIAENNLQPVGIIIHAMGEFVWHQQQIIPAQQFLQEQGLSVHALIDYDGNISRMIDEHQVAKHAGISRFKQLENLNQHFLGVELLISGTHTQQSLQLAMQQPSCYSPGQYKSLAMICQEWLHKYRIKPDYIVGHDQVSGENIRSHNPKYDPGEGFDWAFFRQQLQTLENTPLISTNQKVANQG